MTNLALNKLRALPERLTKNRVYREDGLPFGAAWADGIARFFDGEPAAQSINYPATLVLNRKYHDGMVTIRRDGSHSVQLAPN